ncbi:MAG TPA: ADP-ribosylglycohydrolase family protein [Thermomicrobiales bacterium]|jgi:ADP-ribosyl-[dinitrogen reductase] hydrolase
MVSADLPRGRFVGCLIGLALGDALGAPLEFMPRAEIAAAYGEVRELLGGGWLNVEPGEYTDDTQLALAIAESIVRTGRIDPTDIAARFVAWLRTGPKDVGNITRTAIRYHEQGLAWQEVGPRVVRELVGGSAGNGSLMRCAPVGLFHAARPDALLRDSTIVSEITHANPLSIWSSIAVNLAIVEFLHGRRDDVIARVAAQIPEREVRDTLLTVPNLPRRAIRSGGFVLETLGAAFWALQQGESFEDVVVTAINLGDDADTVGAVAGALAGARDGIGAVPDRWKDQLRDADKLADLALALHRLALKDELADPTPH